MIIKIYDEDMKTVVRESEGVLCQIPFGTIRKLMALVEIESVEQDDVMKLLKVIGGAWGEVTSILGKVFVDIAEDEWDRIPAGDVLRAVVEIAKYSFMEILSVPSDSKN